MVDQMLSHEEIGVPSGVPFEIELSASSEGGGERVPVLKIKLDPENSAKYAPIIRKNVTKISTLVHDRLNKACSVNTSKKEVSDKVDAALESIKEVASGIDALTLNNGEDEALVNLGVTSIAAIRTATQQLTKIKEESTKIPSEWCNHMVLDLLNEGGTFDLKVVRSEIMVDA